MASIKVFDNGVELNHKDIQKMSTARAYYTLAKYRRLLGPEGMRELFKEECARSEEKYLKALETSRPGEYKYSTLEFHVKNCSAADFMRSFVTYTAVMGQESHPEHFAAVLPAGGDGPADVLETVGDDADIIRFLIAPNTDPETFPFKAAPDCSFCMRSELTTVDGKPLGVYIFHQFKNVGDDMVANPCIVFPEATDDAIVEGQKRHIAVEYMNWFSFAAGSRAGTTTPVDLERIKAGIKVYDNGQEVDHDVIRQWESDRAYYTLAKYRRLLGPEGMQELFKEECARSEEKYLKALEASRPGEYKYATLEFHVKNCAAADFMRSFVTYVAVKGKESHPEHFAAVLTAGGDGPADVLETVGDDADIIRFLIAPNTDPETFPFKAAPDCSFCMRSELTTVDGKPLGVYIFHQFKNVGDDMVANPCIVFPEATDDAIVEGQKRHIAVEYLNWFGFAADSRANAQ